MASPPPDPARAPQHTPAPTRWHARPGRPTGDARDHDRCDTPGRPP